MFLYQRNMLPNYIFEMTKIVQKDFNSFYFIYHKILCKIELSNPFSNQQLLRIIPFLSIYTYNMSLTYALLFYILIENLLHQN